MTAMRGGKDKRTWVVCVAVVLMCCMVCKRCNAFELGVSRGVRLGVSSMRPARAVGLNIKNKASVKGSRSVMSMHMGHSHSHSHGHGQSDEESDGGDGAVAMKWHERVLRRSTVTRAVFALMAALGSAHLRRGWKVGMELQKADVAAFVGTWGVVSLGDVMRKEGKKMMAKVRRWRDDILKHRPTFGKELTEKEADRVTILGVWTNLLLSVGKLVTGILCHSSALVADAGHSLSDLFSDFITLWAVQISRLPPDDDHPYGHGKFEAIGSLFLALTLLATGLSVGAVSNRKLFETIHNQRAILKPPTPPALLMAGLSIASKEWLYRITRKVGERLNSQVVIANAWHHRSDAYSSVLALLSIALAITFPSLLAADAAAGLLVAGMICMTGVEILEESVRQLTDTNNQELVTRLTKLLKHNPTNAPKDKDVLSIDRIRARQVGSTAIVDVSVTTPATLSSTANRAVEQRLKHTIMEQEPNVVDAEIRASGPGVVCPLLTHTSTDYGEEHPVTDVEEETRQLLLLHPNVKSVTGVTVHYHDTYLVDVDANVRLANNTPTTRTAATQSQLQPQSTANTQTLEEQTAVSTTISTTTQTTPTSMTIQKASEVASQLKSKLELSENICKANIYLDLN